MDMDINDLEGKPKFLICFTETEAAIKMPSGSIFHASLEKFLGSLPHHVRPATPEGVSEAFVQGFVRDQTEHGFRVAVQKHHKYFYVVTLLDLDMAAFQRKWAGNN